MSGTDGVLGPFSWGLTPAYTGVLYLDGFPLDEREATSFLRPGLGSGIPLLSGASYFQSFSAHPHAPVSLLPLGLSMSVREATPASKQAVEAALERPVDMWVDQWVEERWQLRTGDTRTVFSLSRKTAGLLIPSGIGEKYAPVCRLSDFPKEDPATDTALTVINSGSPASGEILIDPTTETTTVEVNADLVSGADGTRALVVRHWPLRRQKLRSYNADQAPAADVLATLDFGELVAAVEYDDVVQI